GPVSRAASVTSGRACANSRLPEFISGRGCLHRPPRPRVLTGAGLLVFHSDPPRRPQPIGITFRLPAEPPRSPDAETSGVKTDSMPPGGTRQIARVAPR